MTIYVRFLHIARHGPSMGVIETVITACVLLLFLALPVQRLAFFPNPRFRRFAQRRGLACAVVFLLSALGRVALLPIEPFPAPNVHDEFSYLLASDTLAHGRLSNPTPPAWHHFEAFYVLMQPTYSSKYGVALPLLLALGQRAAGSPRAGLVLCMALAAASLCWMLQAYLPAEWALLGGLLAVVRMSWFSYFGNSYWGGAVAILGGCLMMGGAARLRRTRNAGDGLLTALGLLLLANSRPYEGVLVSLPVCGYTLWHLVRRRARTRIWLPGSVVFLAGAACTGYYFYCVTGRLAFPWMVYWRQWSVCPPFFFGRPNYSVHYQFSEQISYNLGHEMLPYVQLRTASDGAAELAVKFIYQWLYFVFPALTLTLIGVVPTMRARSSRLAVITLGFASLGFVLETWLQAHYVAVAGGILYLMMMNGLRWLGTGGLIGLKLLRGTLATVAVMFLVRLVVVPGDTFPPNWASQTGGIPGYEDVQQVMAAKPGRQMVIVRYQADHAAGYSWINNGYDISSQHVIWARDTEPEESNGPLLCAFPDRSVWLLVPPEAGFLRPPDRTAPWNTVAAERFLRPYGRRAEPCETNTSPEGTAESGGGRKSWAGKATR